MNGRNIFYVDATRTKISFCIISFHMTMEHFTFFDKSKCFFLAAGLRTDDLFRLFSSFIALKHHKNE